MNKPVRRSPKIHQFPKQKIFDILVYADFNCTTGFGNVTKELIDRWKKQLGKTIKIHIFAINDQTQKVYSYAPGVKVYPANVMPFMQPNDAYQRMGFLSLLNSVDYNLVFILNDLEIAGSFSADLVKINKDKKKANRLQFKSVLYFPIDSMIRKADLAFLSTFDEIISYTKYAESVIKDLAPTEVSEKIQIIPHGVDQVTFKKLFPLEVIKIKQELFGKNKFVIGTVNRNSARKDLSTLILAFVKLKDDYKNVPSISENLVLYLHCNPTDAFGVNMKYLCSKFELEEGKDVFFPKDYSENKGCTQEELNQLYNCMDVFVSTSTAEGWGLTVTEAMAAETLVIAPLHTSLEELCADKESGEIRVIGILPNELQEIIFVHDGDKVRYKIPVKALTEKLHWALDSETTEVKEQLIKNAKESLNQYDWNRSAARFWEIISKYIY